MFGMGNVEYQAVNVFDLDGHLEDFHDRVSELTGHRPMQPGAGHWGPRHGDLMKLPLESLEDCDGLVAGPPCQPWAQSGLRRGRADPRSDVFLRCVSWIEHLAGRGLWFFALENSTQINCAQSGDDGPFLQEVVDRLRVSLPDFEIDIVTSSLAYFLPHRRSRVWLRGFRRQYCGALPSPVTVCGCGAVRLEDLLQRETHNENIEDLSTANKRRNAGAQMMRVEQMLKENPDHGARIAVFDVDRNICGS